MQQLHRPKQGTVFTQALSSASLSFKAVRGLHWEAVQQQASTCVIFLTGFPEISMLSLGKNLGPFITRDAHRYYGFLAPSLPTCMFMDKTYI